jgi:hypothetical protein
LIFINVRRQPWIASFCQTYKKELLTLCRKGNPNTLFPETLCRKGCLLALLSSPTLSTSTTLEKPEQRPVPPLPLHHWCEDHRSLAFDGLRRPHLIGPWLSSVRDHGSGARSRLYPVFHHDLKNNMQKCLGQLYAYQVVRRKQMSMLNKSIKPCTHLLKFSL